MKPVITLDGFNAKFAANPDPWNTFTDRDEELKRKAIIHAMGPARLGRVWEPACGNGSNIRHLARRSLRLKSSDGSPEAVEIAICNNKSSQRVDISRAVLPAMQNAEQYDAIILAEILYYLKDAEIRQLAISLDHHLKPGGRLILAHHHVIFHDFVQRAQFVHYKLDRYLPFQVRVNAPRRQTSKWTVELLIRRK